MANAVVSKPIWRPRLIESEKIGNKNRERRKKITNHQIGMPNGKMDSRGIFWSYF